MGGLERYVRFLPGHLRATYRLDFLDRTAAKAAIQRPAREHGIEFTDEAAAELVRRLSLVKVQRPDSDVSEIEAPFVQPVQLQVVCRRLWKSVAQKKADDFSAIDLADVEAYADIPKALRSYYGGHRRGGRGADGHAGGHDSRLVREGAHHRPAVPVPDGDRARGTRRRLEGRARGARGGLSDSQRRTGERALVGAHARPADRRHRRRQPDVEAPPPPAVAARRARVGERIGRRDGCCAAPSSGRSPST